MPRNVGSDASRGQVRSAIKTSLGRRDRVSTARSRSRSFNGRRASGSAQGLDASRGVWLQPKGKGYPTTRSQNEKVARDINSLRPPTFRVQPTSNRSMIDYRYMGGETSSISKMSSRMKLDRIF